MGTDIHGGFIKVVKENVSVRDILSELGYSRSSGSMGKKVRDRIKQLGINTDHFLIRLVSNYCAGAASPGAASVATAAESATAGASSTAGATSSTAGCSATASVDSADLLPHEEKETAATIAANANNFFILSFN